MVRRVWEPLAHARFGSGESPTDEHGFREFIVRTPHETLFRSVVVSFPATEPKRRFHILRRVGDWFSILLREDFVKLELSEIRVSGNTSRTGGGDVG
jgi:hypothetical protein